MERPWAKHIIRLCVRRLREAGAVPEGTLGEVACLKRGSEHYNVLHTGRVQHNAPAEREREAAPEIYRSVAVRAVSDAGDPEGITTYGSWALEDGLRWRAPEREDTDNATDR